ncbi:formyl transferase [Ensifer sp.]|jgi:folate-dependent phosphoribosylglycinamide formyltransferase PurN|uniref:formyl transferase n=1 Tax=Ensifer sp. TaxID=1872086 RepID=UPI002E148384|nr:formyl transferase [Ensifer sp.]
MTEIASQNQTTGKQRGRIIVVTAGGENPWVMINALAATFTDITVVEEQPESKGLFLRRRARRLGWFVALGQFATMIASRFGKRFARKRAHEILATYKVSGAPDASIPVLEVNSINDADAILQVRALAPGVVFLISCRMLKAETIAAMPCPVINFHAGVNPAYRGLMGGYWALVNDDAQNFGATVHLVDAGVDTGGVLYQSRQRPSANDTMHTYPLLQTAASTDIAVAAVKDALEGHLRPHDVAGPSRQWYHPPIWTWVSNGVRRGIW